MSVKDIGERRIRIYMRYIVKFFLILGLILSLIKCETKNPEGVKIFGNVQYMANDGYIYLEEVGTSGPQIVDTFDIDNGKFITYFEIDEPAFYRLNFNDKQYVRLILNGKEIEVEINADGNDPKGFSEISGSYDTEYLMLMDNLFRTFSNEGMAIQKRIIEAEAADDQEAYERESLELIKYSKSVEKQLKELIWESTPSLAAIYGGQMLEFDKNIPFLDSVHNVVKQATPNNYLVASLGSILESKRNNISIGQLAPEITLNNPEGEVVKLSSLRGKYVLIDFWAAWCKPCRAENPNVVRMYNEYSDENFEIYGVSLDKSKEAWVNAIEKDNLPWIHVSDLKYWQSEAAQAYQISGIPATFLLDPEGKIIAKNLRGSSLESKLKEIFR